MFERKLGRFLTLEIHTIGLAHEIKDSDFLRMEESLDYVAKLIIRLTYKYLLVNLIG